MNDHLPAAAAHHEFQRDQLEDDNVAENLKTTFSNSIHRKVSPDWSNLVDVIPVAVTMSNEEESGSKDEVEIMGEPLSRPENLHRSGRTDRHSLSTCEDYARSSECSHDSESDDKALPIPKIVTHSPNGLVSLLGCSLNGSVLTTSESENGNSLNKVVRVNKLPGELLSVSGTSIIKSVDDGAHVVSDLNAQVEKLPGELISLAGASIVSSSSVPQEKASESPASWSDAPVFDKQSVSSSLEHPNNLRTPLDADSSVSSNGRKDPGSGPGFSEILVTKLPPSQRALLDSSLTSNSSVEKEPFPSDEENGFSPLSIGRRRGELSTPQVCYEQFTHDENELESSLLQQSMIESDCGPSSEAINETKLSVASIQESVPESPPYLCPNDLGSMAALSPLSRLKTNAMHVALDESNVYLRRIEELEEELRISSLKVNAEVEKRKECENKMDELQQKLLLNESHSETSDTNALVFSDIPGSSPSDSTLMEQNETLVKEVRFKDQTCVELSEKNLKLLEQIDHLQDDLKLSQERNESLHKEVVNATRLGAKWEAKCEALKDQVSESRSPFPVDVKNLEREELAESQKRVQDLTIALNEATTKNSRLEDQIASYQQQIASLSRECEDAKQTITKLSGKAKESLSSVAGCYQESQSIMQEKINELRDICDERTKAVYAEREENNRVRTQLAALQEAVKSTFSEIEGNSMVFTKDMEGKLEDYSARLSNMSESLKNLRDCIEVKSFSRTDDANSFVYSCSVSEESQSAASGEKQDPKPEDSDSDDVLNATLRRSTDSEVSYDVEEKRLEMMEEARNQDVDEHLSVDEEELSGLSHIDGLSRLGEDISTIGSIFMDSPCAYQNDSLCENMETLQEERKQWEEEKRLLSERLNSAQVEYQKLKDCLICHQEKSKERPSLKTTIESQGRLIDILESKVTKLTREKQDLEFGLLRAKRGNDACRTPSQASSVEKNKETTALGRIVSSNLKAESTVQANETDELEKICRPQGSSLMATSDESISLKKIILDMKHEHETAKLKLSLEVEESSRKLGELEGGLSHMEKEKDEMVERCEELSNQIETLTTSEQEYLSRIDQLQTSLRDSELEVKKWKLRFSDGVENTMQQSDGEDSLAEHYEKALQAADLAFKKSSLEIAAAKSTAATLSGENEQLRKALSKLECALRDAQESIASKVARIDDLDKEEAIRKVEVEKLKVSYITCNDMLAGATEQNANNEVLIAGYKSSLVDAEKKLEDSAHEVSTLRAELVRMTAMQEQLRQTTESLNDMTKRLEESQAENACLCEKQLVVESSLSDLSKSRNALIKKIQELRDENKKDEGLLETERNEANRSIEELRRSLDTNRDELQKSTQRCEDLAKQLQDQKRSSDLVTAELERMTLMYSACCDKLEKVSAEHGMNETVIAQLKKEVDMAQIESKRLEAEATTASSTLSAALNEAEKYKAATEKLNQDLIEANEQIDRKEARVILLENEQYQLREKYGAHELELQKLKLSYVACNDELAKVSELNSNYEVQVSELKVSQDATKTEMDNLKRKNLDLEEQITDADQMLEFRTKELVSCRSSHVEKLEEKDKVINALQSTCRDLQSSIDENVSATKSRQEAYAAEIAKELARASTLEQQLALAKTEISRADKEIATTSQAIMIMQDELDSSRAEVLHLTHTHREARERDAHILKEASEARDAATVRLNETVASVDLLTKKLQEHQLIISRLELEHSELSEKDSECSKLRARNDALERKCLRLREYIKQLTTKCESWAMSYQKQCEELGNAGIQTGMRAEDAVISTR